MRPFVPAEPQSKPRRPKVGDRVRLVKTDGYPATKYDGMEGTIIEDCGTNRPLLVRLSSGEEFWCRESRMGVIPDHLDAYRTRQSKIDLILDLVKDLC